MTENSFLEHIINYLTTKLRYKPASTAELMPLQMQDIQVFEGPRTGIFFVIAIVDCTKNIVPPTLDIKKIGLACDACFKYTGKVKHFRLPVAVLYYFVFKEDPSIQIKNQIYAFKRAYPFSKSKLHSIIFVEQNRKIYSTFWFNWYPGYLNKILSTFAK